MAFSPLKLAEFNLLAIESIILDIVLSCPKPFLENISLTSCVASFTLSLVIPPSLSLELKNLSAAINLPISIFSSIFSISIKIFSK